MLGDNSVIPGTENNESPSTVGNNSKFLLIGGDELATKIKSYSALEDVEVTADVNGEDTVITLTYEFDSIDDYNAKTKTLAKDRAEDIVDATFTDNGDGTYTLREWADNAENTVYNIFESLFNDPEAFDPTGAGDLDLTQPQYGVKEIFKIMTVSVTLGDDTQTETLFEYDNSGTGSGNVTDYPDWVEVTAPLRKRVRPLRPAPVTRTNSRAARRKSLPAAFRRAPSSASSSQRSLSSRPSSPSSLSSPRRTARRKTDNSPFFLGSVPERPDAPSGSKARPSVSRGGAVCFHKGQ